MFNLVINLKVLFDGVGHTKRIGEFHNLSV